MEFKNRSVTLKVPSIEISDEDIAHKFAHSNPEWQAHFLHLLFQEININGNYYEGNLQRHLKNIATASNESLRFYIRTLNEMIGEPKDGERTPYLVK